MIARNYPFCFVAVLCAACFIGCGKGNQLSATPYSYEQAFCELYVSGTKVGSGMFVGQVTESGEQVYFLTARHVFTSRHFSGNRFVMRMGSNVVWDASTDVGRWRTASFIFDAAWFALTSNEVVSIRRQYPMRYVSLSNSPSSGNESAIEGGYVRTGLVVRCESSHRLPVLVRSKGKWTEGTMERHFEQGYLFSEYDRKRRKCRFDYCPVDLTDAIKKSDSGGMVIAKMRQGTNPGYALVGLLCAYCQDPKRVAILTMDEINDAINGRDHRICECEDLW